MARRVTATLPVLTGEAEAEIRSMATKIEAKAENNSAYSTYGEGFNEGLREAAKMIRRRAKKLENARISNATRSFSSTMGE